MWKQSFPFWFKAFQIKCHVYIFMRPQPPIVRLSLQNSSVEPEPGKSATMCKSSQHTLQIPQLKTQCRYFVSDRCEFFCEEIFLLLLKALATFFFIFIQGVL